MGGGSVWGLIVPGYWWSPPLWLCLTVWLFCYCCVCLVVIVVVLLLVVCCVLRSRCGVRFGLRCTARGCCFAVSSLVSVVVRVGLLYGLLCVLRSCVLCSCAPLCLCCVGCFVSPVGACAYGRWWCGCALPRAACCLVCVSLCVTLVECQGCQGVGCVRGWSMLRGWHMSGGRVLCGEGRLPYKGALVT